MWLCVSGRGQPVSPCRCMRVCASSHQLTWIVLEETRGRGSLLHPGQGHRACLPRRPLGCESLELRPVGVCQASVTFRAGAGCSALVTAAASVAAHPGALLPRFGKDDSPNRLCQRVIKAHLSPEVTVHPGCRPRDILVWITLLTCGLSIAPSQYTTPPCLQPQTSASLAVHLLQVPGAWGTGQGAGNSGRGPGGCHLVLWKLSAR